MLFRRFFGLLIAWVAFGFLPLVVSAAGTCRVTCTPPGPRATRTIDNATLTEPQCRAICAASPCPTDVTYTCSSEFRPAPSTPAPAAPASGGAAPAPTPAAAAQVCSCTCVPATGTTPTPTVSVTAGTCTNAAACTTVCAQRCAQATAPLTAVMRYDAAAHPATCGASPTAAPTSGGGGGATADVSGDVGEAVPLILSQPIDGVSRVSDLGNYIAVLYRFLIGIAGTAAVIMIVYGGFRYLLGSATDDVSSGKQIIQDALIGLMLVLGAYFILATVNPNTLSLKVPDIRPIARVPLPASPSAFSGRPAASAIGDICRCLGEECRGRTPDCPAQGTCNQGLHQLACPSSQVCVYDLIRTQAVHSAWRCMTIPTVLSESAIQSNQDALRTVAGCTNDEQCQDASHLNNPRARCLMDTAPNGRGYCTLGELGQRCRCTVSTALSRESTAACDEGIDSIFGGVIARYTGSPTNNAGTGFVNCQAGLACKLLMDTPATPAASRVSSYQQRWYCQPSYAGTTPVTPAPTPTPATPTPTPAAPTPAP